VGVGNASARAVVGGGGFRPLVSVVLPTRDRTERLAGALASVVAQSYRQLEIIVVDDASASPVADVIDRVAGDDPRVELMCLATHRGAASARNAALERCSGDVVGFLDDDDRWEPHKIERQVEFLAAHPTVGIVSCDYYVVDERSGHSGSLYRGPTSFSAQQLQWMNFPGSFSFVMARRDLLGDELHIDESFPSVED
jgi:glycosyltransferase involved in cell wall biosynthesis